MMNLGKAIGRIRRNQLGGALVETALTAPLLVLMLLGLVEFGRVAYISIQTSNAARAAVSVRFAEPDHGNGFRRNAGSGTTGGFRSGFAECKSDREHGCGLLVFFP